MVVLFGCVDTRGFREQSSLRPSLIPNREGVQEIKSAIFGRIQIMIKYTSTMIFIEGANIKRDHELDIVSKTLKAQALGDHVWKIIMRICLITFDPKRTNKKGIDALRDQFRDSTHP